MPGPNSKPNGTLRKTKQWIPPGLAERIAAWEALQTSKNQPKSKHHKPGSQKK